MPRKPTGKPNGRPPKEIDWALFESLCNIQCTQAEIANILKISVETLVERTFIQYDMPYLEAYKRFSDPGKASLRRIQFKLAQKNAAMAIWLGKQYLGQRDNEKVEDMNAKKGFEEFNKLVTQMATQFAAPVTAPLEAQLTRVVPIAPQIEAQVEA